MSDMMGAQPVYNVGGGNGSSDGGMGGGGSWMWILVLILLMGGNGFGGLGGGAAAGAAVSQINNDFMYTNLKSTLDVGFGQAANQNFAIQKDLLQGLNGVDSALCNGFSGTGQQIAALGFNMEKCCCETNRNIDSIRYENAKNTCDIVNAIRVDGDATRSIICQNTIQDLRDKVSALELGATIQNGNMNVINAVRPIPQPAYITCSPYQASNAGCSGFNNTCCC